METIWDNCFHQAHHLDWFHSDLRASFTFSGHDLSKSSSASRWIFCYRVLVLGLPLFESSEYLYSSLSMAWVFFFALFAQDILFAVFWWHTWQTLLTQCIWNDAFCADLLSVTCFEVVVNGTTGDWSSEGQEGYSGWVLPSVLGVWFRIAHSGW